MTTPTQKPLYELHTEHKEWLKKLAFYQDEIRIMNSRVAEVASKNTAKDVLAMVEHFQNQLIIQKETIDTFKHEINEHEAFLEKNINDNPTAVDHRKMNDHGKHRDGVNSFEKGFNELRHELIKFLSKVF
jgi:hypothetical protein